MRNTSESLEMLYSAMVREMESDLESTSGNGLPPKVTEFF